MSSVSTINCLSNSQKEEKEMKNDLESTRPILEKIFPKYREYPVNSMMPTVGYNSNGYIASMLIIVDDFMLEDFKKDKSDKVDLEIDCCTKRNSNGIGKDLIIRFDFYFKTGHPVFKTIVYGDLLDDQKRFIEGLKQVNDIMIWILDKDYNIFRVLNTDWNYEEHKDILEPLLQGGLG
jgi:hypothetical protein